MRSVLCDPQTGHLDPLIASSEKNDFLKTVKPFLIDAFGE